MKKYYEVSRDIIVIAGLIVAIYQLIQTEKGLRRSVANVDLQLAGYYLNVKREFIVSVGGGDVQEIEEAASN